MGVVAVTVVGLLDVLHTRASSGSAAVFAAAARLALYAVSSGDVLPVLQDGQNPDAPRARWRVLVDTDELDALAGRLPPAGHALLCSTEPARVRSAAWTLRHYVDAIADDLLRDADVHPESRPRARLLPWTARWAAGLADRADPVVPLGAGAGEIVAGVRRWAGLVAAPSASGGALELTLTQPATVDGAWHLDLGLRHEDGTYRAAQDVWSDDDPTGEVDRTTLLTLLPRAAALVGALEQLLMAPSPADGELTRDQVGELLDAEAALGEAGVVLTLPPDLRDGALALRLLVDSPSSAALRPQRGADASYVYELQLEGAALTDEEVRSLADARAPLLHVRDRWVRVDPDRVRRWLGALGQGTLTVPEALTLALAGSEPLGETAAAQQRDDADPEHVEVVAGAGLEGLLQRLRDAADPDAEQVEAPGFVGTLRGYQQRALTWLQGMADLGLGAVLADDMGLGKTVTLIAHLLASDGGAGPHLVICPTAVLGNWQRELHRFAPTLAVTRHHGPQRAEDLQGVSGVVVTTYGTARTDADALAGQHWRTVTLDEAQSVKNASTRTAGAVRRLRGQQRLALSGTPLENRLEELWTLLDATNPGLLGSRAAFLRRFVAPVERDRDPEAARRLRRLIAPFVLRRRKGDPGVLLDLPPKTERVVEVGMTAEQVALYRAAVRRTLDEEVPEASGMRRRGLVLALLTRLKQVCNHPAQALREEAGEAALPGRSGKLEATRLLVREAVDSGEQTVIFTQYVRMGRLLARQLGEDLDDAVPLLHGGLTPGARDQLIDRFQQGLQTRDGVPPVLVASLRAGGTGVNLTAATQVVHYDRWWNPAVEDQATDRTHRIGQTRPVTVHVLQATGTVEERVAEVLVGKRDLAERVVSDGETWLTELNDAELAAMVALTAEPVTSHDLVDDEEAGRSRIERSERREIRADGR